MRAGLSWLLPNATNGHRIFYRFGYNSNGPESNRNQSHSEVPIVGGSANDGINNQITQLAYNYGDQFRGEVIVDDQDNIYIASCTQSTGNFPMRLAIPHLVLNQSDQDACVFSLNRNCSNMRFWHLYWRGFGIEAAYSLKRNSYRTISLVTGGTSSDNFPVMRNSLDGTHITEVITDGFICMFNSDLSTLIILYLCGYPGI